MILLLLTAFSCNAKISLIALYFLLFLFLYSKSGRIGKSCFCNFFSIVALSAYNQYRTSQHDMANNYVYVLKFRDMACHVF